MTIRSLSAGDLQAQLLQTDDGVLLHRLADKKSGRIFLKEDSVLFTLTARKLWDGSLLTVDSAAGWERVCVSGEFPAIPSAFSDTKSFPA